MNLSIIIVNYNVKYFLEQCLFAVVKATKELEAEIFVVDNASTDGSREYFHSRFPGVHFKWDAENAGFAKANNSVLKETKGDYILFLNPDTVIAEDCLQLCLSFAAAQKDFGALGIRMIDGSGKFLPESKRSFPSASGTFFKMTGLNSVFPRSRIFSNYYAGNLSENNDHAIDVIAGAFMMISKKALEKTHGFDEDFFMYGEDVDLSFRIRKAGFVNYYFAGSTIIHFKGESTQKRSKFYIKHFYGAMELFVKKHVTGKGKAGMMRLGIAAARKLAGAKLLFSSREKEITGNSNVYNTTAILSSQKRFNDIIRIVKFADKPLVIKGRVAASARDSESSIGKVKDLEHLVQRKMFNHLIFSEADIPFKDIIAIVEKFKAKLTFLFHAKGSRSIVGSSNKNGNGITIAEE